MIWSLALQALTFRASVILVDYAILAVIWQHPVEAGIVTIVRHTFHTFMYWVHEIAWAPRSLDHTPQDLAASRRHTIHKTISFRAISLVADLILLWLLTGNLWFTGIGALLIAITNTIFFYYHDRWWETWRARHTSNKPHP